MNINEYLEKNKNIRILSHGWKMRDLAPQVECTDGFKMSVQVSSTHYCKPRENDAGFYYSMEVGFPSEREELLMPYAEQEEKPTETVYGYVPAEIIDAVIDKHGGMKLTE